MGEDLLLPIDARRMVLLGDEEEKDPILDLEREFSKNPPPESSKTESTLCQILSL